VEPEILDCTWCGSAKSVSNGLCQVCLMDYSQHAQVIPLPSGSKPKIVLDLEPEVSVAD
jgi:hypothetical protein